MKVDRDIGHVRDLLSQPGNGRVLVVDGGGARDCALVGDMVAGAALENGWAGLVINGAVRDTAGLAAIQLGIVALTANPRQPQRTDRGHVDIPVNFGGVRFNPGEFLVCDEDGVVVLSNDGAA